MVVVWVLYNCVGCWARGGGQTSDISALRKDVTDWLTPNVII